MARLYGKAIWVKDCAYKERERREKIDAFQKALPKFMELLSAALESDCKEYQNEFPGAKTEIHQDLDKGTITAECQTLDPPTKATVLFHSESQQVSCGFNSQKHRSFKERLEMSDFWLGTQTPDRSAKDLAEKILKPVVFPSL